MKSERTFGVELEFLMEAPQLWSFFYANKEVWFPHWKKMDEDELDGEFDNMVIDDEGRGPIDHINIFLKDKGFQGWTAKEDGSVDGDLSDIPIEIASGILQGDAGLKELKRLLSYFTKYSYVNETCGLHVHIGAEDFKEGSQGAKRTTLAMLTHGSLEDVFDKLVASSRQKNENQYARGRNIESILEGYRNILDTGTNPTTKMIARMLSGQGRYFKLNILSLPKFGTLEFRQLEGTMDYSKIQNWIKLCSTFVDSVVATEDTFEQMFDDLNEAIRKAPKTTMSVTKKSFLEHPNFDFIEQAIGEAVIGPLNQYLNDNVTTVQNPGTFSIDNVEWSTEDKFGMDVSLTAKYNTKQDAFRSYQYIDSNKSGLKGIIDNALKAHGIDGFVYAHAFHDETTINVIFQIGVPSFFKGFPNKEKLIVPVQTDLEGDDLASIVAPAMGAGQQKTINAKTGLPKAMSVTPYNAMVKGKEKERERLNRTLGL